MGIFDFVKSAGERLFGGKEARAEAKQETEEALVNQVNQMGLKVEDLSIEFNKDVALIKGSAASQEEKEKVVLMVGNTKGVGQVDDQMTVQMQTAESIGIGQVDAVQKQTAESILYTVASGDTLSKIAKEQYGSSGKYMAIFDANKPMLKDPNKIYPGQVLRIPPLK